MKIVAEIGVSGLYQLEVTKADGKVEEYPWMDNVVLDQGLGHVIFNSGQGGYNKYNNYRCMYLGTGGSAALPTDTWLESYYATSTGPSQSSGYGAVDEFSNMYNWIRGTYEFPAVPSVGGVIVKECGVGYMEASVSNSKLTTRSRFTVGGVPFDLSLNQGDILKVTYEIRIYPPTEPVVSTFDLNDDPLETRTVTMYPYGINSASYWNVSYATNSSIAYNQLRQAGLLTGAVPPATPTSVYGASGSGGSTNSSPCNLGLADCNFAGGIDGAYIRVWCNYDGAVHASFMCTIDPPIMKDNTMVASYSYGVQAVRYVP